VDALLPFPDDFLKASDVGASFGSDLAEAAAAAPEAARQTADLRPLKGRARPLAEKSLGHPDPGAVSFGLITERIATYIESGAGTSAADNPRLAAAAGNGAKND
jgi:dihydroxyacetone kinase